jgi:apolipoprotein D and lipocalin family protein
MKSKKFPMNKMRLGLVAIMFCGVMPVQARTTDLPVVSEVDLSRYAGDWYEIAMIPHWFERGCVDTTATYTLRPEGKVHVLNQCQRNGQPHRAKATAWHEGPGHDGKFTVQFFWPLRSPYWVIALDPHYQWAVVGHPSRRYFWILSRTPDFDPALYNRLMQKAGEFGYDVSQIQRTSQSKSR